MSREEQVRIEALKLAIEKAKGSNYTGSDIINLAERFENFIRNGKG